MSRLVRSLPRPTPLSGWAIITLSSVIMVLDIIQFGDGHLLPGAHSPLWLAVGVVGLLGGARLIGSTYR